MTRNDIVQIMAWVLANHPHMQDQDLRPTVQLWERMFADVDRERFETAIMKVMARNPFFPTVAAISKALMIENDPTPIEAWGEVTKAIRIYGYCRPEEALSSMSPLTKQVTISLGWMNICSSEEPDVIRGQFMNHYSVLAQRAKDMAVLPKKLRLSDPGMASMSDAMKNVVDMLTGDVESNDSSAKESRKEHKHSKLIDFSEKSLRAQSN